MAEEIFIDASFWVSLMLRQERHHSTARELWEETIAYQWARVTTNWTLYEAATFMNGRIRARHDLAIGLLELASATTQVSDAYEFEGEALEVFKGHSDKRWSVVDCANFVCIRKRQSSLALSFDRDFAQAQTEFGFTLLGAGASR